MAALDDLSAALDTGAGAGEAGTGAFLLVVVVSAGRGGNWASASVVASVAVGDVVAWWFFKAVSNVSSVVFSAIVSCKKNKRRREVNKHTLELLSLHKSA